MPPPASTNSMSKPIQGPVKKPLASMLPEKYKNVDITELFPEFRENQVLRFSRLFPIKSSYKPRIWKNVKRRFKSENDNEDSGSPANKKSKGKMKNKAVKGKIAFSAILMERLRQLKFIRFHNRKKNDICLI